MVMAKLEADELKEFLRFIDELKKLTGDGAMKWTPATPTTYIADTNLGTSPARIALQRTARSIPSVTGVIGGVRVATSPRRNIYILQAFEMPGLILRVTLDGGSTPDLNEPLRGLYVLVDMLAKRSGLDFLQKILPK
jgi:hypothetical protein